MKKSAILFLFLCSFSMAAHPLQDSIKVLNDRIKELKNDTEKYEKELKNLKKYNESLQKKMQQLAYDTVRCENELKNLKKTNKKNSYEYQDSIKMLAKINDEMNMRLKKMRNDLAEAEKDIEKCYDKNSKKQGMAKQVLTERYNEEKVKNNIKVLNVLDRKDSTIKLIKVLEGYKEYNENLKVVIEKIIEITNDEIGETDRQQERKLGNILSVLSQYIHNNRFNLKFSDYPYLSSIIFEIMDIKQNDVNADISGLLVKL
ncbi:MAG: hypothetical protein FWC26_10965 [Fibromonadales bacterium]|nr:hypothetical protein [Fibromonadales bacterium]